MHLFLTEFPSLSDPILCYQPMLTYPTIPKSLSWSFLHVIHVQYTQTESMRLRHFTIQLDSHVTSQLDSHGVASRKSTCGITNRQQEKWFVSIQSNRLESTTFSTTLYSPPEVKICEITIHANWLPAWPNRLESTTFSTTLYSPTEVKIHEITILEPSSFSKRGHKLQSIHTIRVDSIELTWIDSIFNPPSKSRSTIFSKSPTNRLPAYQINRRGNDPCRFDGIGFTNQFPVCRIANTKDESTLVGCIGQSSSNFCSILTFPALPFSSLDQPLFILLPYPILHYSTVSLFHRFSTPPHSTPVFTTLLHSMLHCPISLHSTRHCGTLLSFSCHSISFTLVI